MIPQAAAATLSLVPAIAKLVQSGRMKKEAAELGQQYQRPDYEVAPSISQMTGYAKGLTQRGDMPGGQLMRDQIGEATASGITAMKGMGTGAEAYGGISQLVQGQLGALRNQSLDLATLNQQGVGNYLDALGMQAGEEAKAWQWNEADPYIMAANKAAMLEKGGIEGTMAGISDIAGVGAGFLGGLEDMDWQGILSGIGKPKVKVADSYGGNSSGNMSGWDVSNLDLSAITG